VTLIDWIISISGRILAKFPERQPNEQAHEIAKFLRTILIAACTPRHWDILRDLICHSIAR
jgi:hypothetical protein